MVTLCLVEGMDSRCLEGSGLGGVDSIVEYRGRVVGGRTWEGGRGVGDQLC